MVVWKVIYPSESEIWNGVGLCDGVNVSCPSKCTNNYGNMAVVHQEDRQILYS